MPKVDWTQEEILELIKQGKKQHEIAQIYQVTDSTMSMWISRIPKALVDEARQEAEKRKQEDILELIRQGKSQHEIAQIYQVTDSAMKMKISRIPKALVDEARQEAKRRKQEDILELIRQGKSQHEIAQIYQVTDSTMSMWISRIPKALVDEARQEANGLTVGTTYIQEKMNQKELTKEDVKSYREVIDDKYDRATNKEVILLVNAYIKTGQTTEAIRFLNMTINNEDLAYLGVEKLEKAKMQVEQIQKRQMARRLLKDDMRISYIMAQTGLKEREVLALKKDMEKRLGTQI